VAALGGFWLAPGMAHAATTIEGVAADLATNVQQFLDEPRCDAAPAEVRRYLRDLPDSVRPALEGFGYYGAHVKALRLPDEESCWTVRLTIEPGEPVGVRDVTVRVDGAARSDSAVTALAQRFPLEPGSVLRHDRYREFKGRLAAVARERGYFDARYVEERVDVYPAAKAADITLVLDSGARYAFGDVRFDADVLATRVLESFVPFARGEPYDSAAIARLQRDLSASGYFSSVRVEPLLDEAHDGLVPLAVELSAAEPTSPASATRGATRGAIARATVTSSTCCSRRFASTPRSTTGFHSRIRSATGSACARASSARTSTRESAPSRARGFATPKFAMPSRRRAMSTCSSSATRSPGRRCAPRS
jgi:hypothetical protein